MDAVVVAVTASLVAAAVLVSVPVVFLLVQLVSAKRGATALATTAGPAGPPTVAVLIPAHNEAEGIVRTLRSVKASRGMSQRLVVVADNCDDDTAAVAQSLGAEVVSRIDPDRRGKGYALAAGMDYLKATPGAAPDVVILLDADCIVGPDALKILTGQCIATNLPAQGLYLVTVTSNASLGERLGAFAWRVRNEARPKGLTRLGLACHIMGSGMAFPWSIISRLELAGGALAEDLLLGADLALEGQAPRLCEAAVIETSLAQTNSGRAQQKTRWVQGHLDVLRSRFGPLLRRSVRRGDAIALFVALDLAIPPLALLLSATTLLLGLAILWSLATGSALSAIAALLPWFGTLVSLALAWSRFGRDLISPAELLTEGPTHLLGTLRGIGALIGGRRVPWERTSRSK